jgi:hypothetical protein
MTRVPDLDDVRHCCPDRPTTILGRSKAVSRVDPRTRRAAEEEGSAMTRVLVVHHDPDQADIEVDRLRRAGDEVQQCAGPLANTCPLLHGAPCPQVEWAETLVYDAWISGDGEQELIEQLRALHPDKPITLMSGGLSPTHHQWHEPAPTHAPAW